MKLALCAYHPNPDIFHAEKEGGGSTVRAEAMKVCMRCPVRAECNDYRERIGAKEGIWGGELQKRNVKKKN